mmetsp:Transcript_7947/g.19656  ORF Transcript_7947/g.19656 Transcript_7947/m.19656 type:complete len:328 (+) Transcript_7947:405-1388(+)
MAQGRGHRRHRHPRHDRRGVHPDRRREGCGHGHRTGGSRGHPPHRRGNRNDRHAVDHRGHPTGQGERRRRRARRYSVLRQTLPERIVPTLYRHRRRGRPSLNSVQRPRTDRRRSVRGDDRQIIQTSHDHGVEGRHGRQQPRGSHAKDHRRGLQALLRGGRHGAGLRPEGRGRRHFRYRERRPRGGEQGHGGGQRAGCRAGIERGRTARRAAPRPVLRGQSHPGKMGDIQNGQDRGRDKAAANEAGCRLPRSSERRADSGGVHPLPRGERGSQSRLVRVAVATRAARGPAVRFRPHQRMSGHHREAQWRFRDRELRRAAQRSIYECRL